MLRPPAAHRGPCAKLMNISSRTPEGEENRCSICGHVLRLEPSRPPGDGTCPSCGCLIWFYTSFDDNAREAEQVLGTLVPDNGEPMALTSRHLVVGRRGTCDIRLDSSNVSAVHCVLFLKDGHWIIRDLKSRNGVKVNGKKIAEAVLCPGDRISIARAKFTIHYSLAHRDDSLSA